jgi:AraC-like DNA-binding protein
MKPFPASSWGALGVNRPNGTWHLAAQTHERHEMIILLKGRQWVRLEHGAPFDARVGDVLLFAQGRAHEEGCDASDELESGFFSFDHPGAAAWPARVHDADGRIRQLAGWMRTEQQRAKEPSPAFTAFAQALLAEYERLVSTPPEPPLLAKLRSHIRAHLTGALTLDGLARLGGVSKYHLIRAWKQSTGHTPMEEIRFLRASHARDLILTTALPLKEIAVRAGFNDEITLNRVCHHCFGIPPGALRQPRRLAVVK